MLKEVSATEIPLHSPQSYQTWQNQIIDQRMNELCVETIVFSEHLRNVGYSQFLYVQLEG
jgi:hypothetical protein